MDFILLAIAALGLWGFRPRKPGEDHLSREQTTAINGFFVLLVFLRHARDYITMDEGARFFLAIDDRLGQLIVVPFLFYSGYGIMRSILKKGDAYVSGLPKNRIFKVWYHFALVVALYILLGLYLDKGYPLKRVLLSFTGWESIGNSNWYIFYTLVMYVCTWIAFKIFKTNHHLALGALTVLAVGYILLLTPLKGSWWYNTALTYPAGMAYGLYRERIEGWLGSKNWTKIAAFLLCAAGFVLCFEWKRIIWGYEAMTIFFALTIVALTLFMKFGNPVLAWLGKYTFEIYILQRIPMILLRGWIANDYVYLAAGAAATVLLAVLFHRLLTWTDSLLYRKGVKV